MASFQSKTRNAKVSVGLPVYNGENYLQSALDSILAMDYTELEVIICDNASSDRTADICTSMASIDPRIKYTRNDTNIGGFRNNNKVLDLSTGDFFLLAGHDDLRDPSQATKCVRALLADTEAVMCYTNTIYIDENGDRLLYSENVIDYSSQRPSERFMQAIRADHKVEPVYGFVRSSALKGVRFGLFADSDRVWVAELALKGTFLRLDEELFFRRDHSEKSTQKFASRYDRIGWFDPGREVKFKFPYFRQLGEYLRVVARADLAFIEKTRCFKSLLGWAITYRRHLIGDVRYSAKALVRPIVRPILRLRRRQD